MEPDKDELPSSDDYEIVLYGVGAEMVYVVRNKNTGVHEYTTSSFAVAFSELTNSQADYDEILALFFGEDDSNGEIVH